MRSEIRIQQVLIALTLGACGAATTIDEAWVAPTAKSTPQMQKVATLYISDNVTMRHAAEDQLARDLNAAGVAASPSYTVLGDASNVGKMDAQKNQLRELGFDGVVVMRVVDKEQQLEGYPAYDWNWGYWGY